MKTEDLLAAEGLAVQGHLFLDLLSRPITRETSRQMAMAAMGIMTELVKKSKKSKNGIPRMVTEASGP